MQSTISIDELCAALDLGERELVSIVGGGGKTTTLFALGAQLTGRIVLTTTTKMGRERTEGRPVLIAPDDRTLDQALTEHGVALVWQSMADHRADGVPPERCDRWFVDGVADHVIVEADGSRRRPFKAPYPYEPVVPAETTLLIACIGASALDLPIVDGCHRADAVAALIGATVDDRLTPERAAHVLLHDDGSRRGLPRDARFVIVVHQVRDEHTRLVTRLAECIGGQARLVAVRALS